MRYNRALARFAAGRRDEALDTLRDAVEEVPKRLAWLLKTDPQPPPPGKWASVSATTRRPGCTPQHPRPVAAPRRNGLATRERQGTGAAPETAEVIEDRPGKPWRLGNQPGLGPDAGAHALAIPGPGRGRVWRPCNANVRVGANQPGSTDYGRRGFQGGFPFHMARPSLAVLRIRALEAGAVPEWRCKRLLRDGTRVVSRPATRKPMETWAFLYSMVARGGLEPPTSAL